MHTLLLVGAVAPGRAMRATLYGIAPGDPVALAVAALVLLFGAAAACWLPARRAGATDPVRALEEE